MLPHITQLHDSGVEPMPGTHHRRAQSKAIGGDAVWDDSWYAGIMGSGINSHAEGSHGSALASGYADVDPMRAITGADHDSSGTDLGQSRATAKALLDRLGGFGGNSAAALGLALGPCMDLARKLEEAGLMESSPGWSGVLASFPDEHYGAADLRGVWVLTPVLWTVWATKVLEQLSGLSRARMLPGTLEGMADDVVADLGAGSKMSTVNADRRRLYASARGDARRTPWAVREEDVAEKAGAHVTVADWTGGHWNEHRADWGLGEVEPESDPFGVTRPTVASRQRRSDEDSMAAGMRARAAWNPSATKETYDRLARTADLHFSPSTKPEYREPSSIYAPWVTGEPLPVGW